MSKEKVTIGICDDESFFVETKEDKNEENTSNR